MRFWSLHLPTPNNDRGIGQGVEEWNTTISSQENCSDRTVNQGLEQKLTGVEPAHVVREILA